MRVFRNRFFYVFRFRFPFSFPPVKKKEEEEFSIAILLNSSSFCPSYLSKLPRSLCPVLSQKTPFISEINNLTASSNGVYLVTYKISVDIRCLMAYI